MSKTQLLKVTCLLFTKNRGTFTVFIDKRSHFCCKEAIKEFSFFLEVQDKFAIV